MVQHFDFKISDPDAWYLFMELANEFFTSNSGYSLFDQKNHRYYTKLNFTGVTDKGKQYMIDHKVRMATEEEKNRIDYD